MQSNITSRFDEFQAKRDRLINQKIEKILLKQKEFFKLSEEQQNRYLLQADRQIDKFESQDEQLERYIVHIDMDAFFASVETLECPIYHQLPMAVGSTQMLSTANYEARKFGVKSAMPGYMALRLCPDLIIIPVDYQKYRRYSEKIQTIFARYDPHYSMAGLDEAYLDLTEYLQRCSAETDIEKVVSEIRGCIFDQFGLTASAGIAGNSLVAKICSDMRKPNGQFSVKNDRKSIREFIWSLSTKKIPGIGKSMGRILDALDIKTCADLYCKRAEVLYLFGQCTAEYLLRCSIGVGSSGYFSSEIDEKDGIIGKSISTEFTFDAVGTSEEMICKLNELARRLAEDIQEKSCEGFTVTLKLKSIDFEVRTRSKTLPLPVSTEKALLDVAVELLKKEPNPSVRLMGLRLSNLRPITASHLHSLTRPLECYGFSRNSPLNASNDSKLSSIPDKMPSVTCPICKLPLSLDDNVQQNEHLDLCLNRPLIRSSIP